MLKNLPPLPKDHKPEPPINYPDPSKFEAIDQTEYFDAVLIAIKNETAKKHPNFFEFGSSILQTLCALKKEPLPLNRKLQRIRNSLRFLLQVPKKNLKLIIEREIIRYLYRENFQVDDIDEGNIHIRSYIVFCSS